MGRRRPPLCSQPPPKPSACHHRSRFSFVCPSNAAQPWRLQPGGRLVPASQGPEAPLRMTSAATATIPVTRRRVRPLLPPATPLRGHPLPERRLQGAAPAGRGSAGMDFGRDLQVAALPPAVAPPPRLLAPPATRLPPAAACSRPCPLPPLQVATSCIPAPAAHRCTSAACDSGCLSGGSAAPAARSAKPSGVASSLVRACRLRLLARAAAGAEP